MKASQVLVALMLLVASTAQSQVASRPAVAAPRAPTWTRHGDLRISGFIMPTTRLVSSSDDAFATGSASIKGGEFYWRYINGGGIRLRYLGASRTGSGDAAGKMTYLDAAVMFGSRAFAIELGYVHRAEDPAAGDTAIGLVQAGWRTEVKVGSSGVSIGIRGAYMREPKLPDKSEATDPPVTWGLIGETWASYAPPRYPVFGQIGFRREIRTQTGDVKRPEEQTSLFVGIGFQTGMRR